MVAKCINLTSLELIREISSNDYKSVVYDNTPVLKTDAIYYLSSPEFEGRLWNVLVSKSVIYFA
jgi:hypothetical protein